MYLIIIIIILVLLKFATRGYVTLLAKTSIDLDVMPVEDNITRLHKLAMAVVDFCWLPTDMDDLKKAASLSTFPYCICFDGINNVIELGIG